MTKTLAAGQWVLAGLLDLLLPNTCAGCQAEALARGGLCEECSMELLRLVALPYCPRCGATLGLGVPVYPDGCPQCPTPLPRFSRVFRLGPYASPLRNIVRELKYHGQLGMCGRLGAMLAEAVAADERDAEFDLIVPVPMYWTRRLGRGANHAHLLADALAAELSLPVGPELARTRNTPPQVHMSRTKRIANVRGAFGVRHVPAIRDANVLLVDDVTTTGATANEAARQLRKAGAADVVLAVVAKAEKPVAYTRHWQ
ncbi:MAG: ComF family protein [Phycisphaerae bacterium]|nr:ComF family protein [Phycisphaerae bacterium]